MADAEDDEACKSNRKESACKKPSPHSRRSRQSSFRPFTGFVDIASIIELARFRIAENRGGFRNLHECEMHHVVDISTSRPIGLFQNFIGGLNVLRGCI
jgi:hypothetical protein